MSQTRQAEQPEGQSPQVVLEINAIPDPALRAFATGCELGDTIPVVLTVKGLIISGIMIGSSAFFEELEEFLRASGYAAMAGEFVRPATETTHAADGAPAYVHLRDARIIPTALTPPHQQILPPLLWRGRLSEIDGWSLGILDVESGPATSPAQ
jgi:hypothetical protein